MGRNNSATTATTKPEQVSPVDSDNALTPSDLKEQNARLRKLAECRSTLLSHLTHELRTPLTSILGFSEILLSQEKLTDAQRNFCERIQNSAYQLQASLSQLAELARMEIDSSTINRHEFSLVELCHELHEALSLEALKQNVKFELRSADDLPEIVSDRDRLRRALRNLLSSSIKLTSKGGRALAAVAAGDENSVITIRYDVDSKPETPGVRPNKKAESAELGITIAAHDLELLGATIERDANENQIIVHLPFKSAI